MASGRFFAFFIFLIFNTGSSAGDTVFVETGASVKLDIQREKLAGEIWFIFWENEKSHTVVTYNYAKNEVSIEADYKNRVDFNQTTLSLTLKNMQKNHSGVYTAKIIGKLNKDIPVSVSVIDAVEAPDLTVISNSSSDSCTVNLTCTGQNLTLNFTYTNSSCSPEKVTLQEKYTHSSLVLICGENTIICNHSNPVSWRKDETDMKQFCKVPEKTENHQDSSNFNLVIGCVVGCVVLVGLVALGISCCWKRHEGGRQVFDTVYEVGAQPIETIKTEPHTYDVPERTPSQTREEKESNTIYHLVGQPPSQPVTAETEHTIYSQVCKQTPPKRPDTTSSNNTRNQTEDCG